MTRSRSLGHLRSVLDVSTYGAVIILMRREVVAEIDALQSIRSFGHVIDDGRLASLREQLRRLDNDEGRRVPLSPTLGALAGSTPSHRGS
jgi:hypothetical protein